LSLKVISFVPPFDVYNVTGYCQANRGRNERKERALPFSSFHYPDAYGDRPGMTGMKVDWSGAVSDYCVDHVSRPSCEGTNRKRFRNDLHAVVQVAFPTTAFSA
jgi:hypothetical protein